MKGPIAILFLTCLILVSGQASNPTKYDFLHLGCYSTPSTFSFNAMTQSNAIANTDSMTWSLCARNCQFQNYQYAAVKTTQCFCSNTVNAAHKVSDSLCSTNCAGDSTEKCGASSYQNVLDLSTVVGTVCPSNVFAEQGSLCCPERASFRLIDQSLLDFLDSLFPPIDFSKYPTGNGKLTEAQLAQRAAYLNSQISPNVWFVTEGSINISVVGDGAGYRNQMGYFLIDSKSQLPIANSFKDVFGDMSWDSSPNKNPSTLKYKSCVPRLGLTATIGPFPAGTGVGFFLHANGASGDYISSTCRSKTALINCLIQNGGRNYDCYRNNACSIDAAQGSVTPKSSTLYTWASIDSLNLKDKVNNRRHVALIDTSYGVVLGFEDLFDLGDQDYNDAMFLLAVSGEYSGNFPTLCNPSCNELNGKCDYNTGTCQCYSATGVTQSSTCDCQSACTKCTSGGTCRCSDKKCICKDGFTHSPAGNDCACSTVVGTCFGSNTNFNCGTCNCNNGYSLPTTGGPNTGTYLYSFGLPTTPVIGDYVLATGAVISGTSFGTFGWDTDHTSQATQYAGDGQPNNSIIKMKKNAKWTVYLKPNWNYDVSVTMGSQADSTYNLNVISGSSTFSLASNLALGVNQYVEKTQRVTTGSDGKIVLQESNVADSTTRLTSVKISAAPCSCLSCPSGGCGPGKCNCYTGKCECPTGFTGANCDQCVSGYFGATCQPCPNCGQGTCNDGKTRDGKCTCNPGWISSGGNCNTCATGYWGHSCQLCPTCVPGQGVCNSGYNGDGKCNCNGNFDGTLCNQCKSNSGGSSCTTCPDCGHGTCNEGITGTGKCNCEAGWVQGSTGTSTNVNSCDTCASGYFGSSCLPCPNCGQGTCNSGISGNGGCTCYTGWMSSGGNCNACAAGYYGPNCAPCGSTCATCSSATSCDTCKESLLYNYGQCVQNCPPGTYQNGNKCLNCDNSCKTCSGGSSNQCTSCPSGYLQEGVCVSSCSTGFYVSGTNCLPCQSPCTTCQTTATTCTTCSGAYNLYNSQCITTCPDGTWKNGNVCQSCNSNCATCSGSPTTCTSCSGNLALSGTTCVPNCPPGTWKNGNVCSNCDSSCATCSGSATNCLSCPSNLVKQGSTCIGSCNEGYYEDSNKICQSCQNPCKTCSNSATHCDSCVNGYKYVPESFECTTKCSANQYQDGETCYSCDNNCATCNGGSSSDCLSCPEGKLLQNKACVTQCDDNYYVNGDKCLPCSNNCATCETTSTYCQTCPENQYLQNNICVGTCNTNYYISGTNCFPCDDNCATCSGSATTCQSCSGSLALSGTECVGTCPPGTWKDGNVCSNCITCATCSGSATTCTSCSGSLALSGTECVSTCPDGTWKNGNVCSNCDSSCATCNGGSSSNCLTCPSHLVKQGSTCIGSCNNGYYQDSNKICQPCDDNCLTCSGSATTCTSCKQTSGAATHLQDTTCVINCDSDRYVDSNGDCIPCHSTCTTCDGGLLNDCLSCSDSLFLDVDKCTPTCSDSHQYANTNTNKCEECDSSCLTCTGPLPNQCTSCPGGTSSLDGTTCVSKCPDGKYANLENNHCENCFFNCKTCTSGPGQYQCDSCSGSLSLSPTGACVSTCPDGYYSLNNVCEECDETCLTCSQSSSNCLTCPPSTYFHQGTCVSDCPLGYYNYEEATKYCHECATPRPCANGGVADCVTGNCDCTGTGFSGALCTCSEAQCPKNSLNQVCSNNAPCTCSECQCDPARYFGSACECKQCPGVTPCSGKGTCNCDGICKCEDGYVGLDCSIQCRYDECGVCFGDGSSCAGCDGVSNSNKVFDACDVCGGDGSSCAGCDGVPNSKKTFDVCGVCNGDGSSCKDRLACEARDSCGACNQGIGSANLRLCVWCNSTQTCMLLSDKPQCVSPLDTCSTDTPTAPAETDQFTSNESNNTGVIVGAVLGCVVAAAAIGALVYMVKSGKGPLNFEPPLLEDNPAAYNNPLYQEYSPGYDNPIYVDPKK